MRPIDRAVLVSLLSFAPYSWDTLLSGRRLRFSRRSDEVAERAGISVRSLASSTRRLSDLGLVRMRSRGRLPSSWEVLPSAFGLVDDDVARRRLSASTTRRYVALPFSVVGELSPSELVLLLDILTYCGARPYSRLDAGERLITTFDDDALSLDSGMTARTARRALERLKDRGLVDGEVRRGRWIVEVHASTFGITRASAAVSDLRNIGSDSDKSAEQGPSLLIHVHEGDKDRRGTRARAASLYPVVLSLAYGGQPIATSPSVRGRIAQACLRLALVEASPDFVSSEGWRLARATGLPPRPEAVVDAVLGRLAVTSVRFRSESQFTAARTCHEKAETSVLEPLLPLELASTYDELELRVWRWKAQLEAGDPAAESFRELLGGLLPWEIGYVPRALRQEPDR